MNHLLREFAPISDEAWEAIEDEARSRLTTYLAARKLVDFAGPHGWAHSAVALGRAERIHAPAEGIEARMRRVMPLVELRALFEVSRRDLEDAERGVVDVDFTSLDDAARRIAVAENGIVFRGHSDAGITGLLDAGSHEPLRLTDDVGDFPRLVAEAVEVLRGSGISGPYALAIGPAGHTAIVESAEPGGVLLRKHLEQILGGHVVWTPGIEGAVVLSLRGGDFVLDVGEDISLGYLAHTVDTISLYFEESLTFRVAEPDAAVALVR